MQPYGLLLGPFHAKIGSPCGMLKVSSQFYPFLEGIINSHQPTSRKGLIVLYIKLILHSLYFDLLLGPWVDLTVEETFPDQKPLGPLFAGWAIWRR